jgi:hypothetical protein
MNSLPRRVLIVDGAHYDRLRSTFGTGLDFRKLLALLGQNGVLSVLHYHRDLRDREEEGRQSALLDRLSDHGFAIYGHEVPESSSQRKERYGTNLVGLAVDALATCQPGDSLLLIAGDTKLAPLAEELKARGVAVTLVSTLSASQSFAPQPELLRQVDAFIDLEDHLSDLALNQAQPAP